MDLPPPETRPLGRTGLKLSAIGFGAAPLGSMYGAIDRADAVRSVHHAVEHGINFFDTSAYYNDSEVVLGEALRGGWRDRIVLCTKGGRISKTEFDFSPAHVRASLERSLARLGTDHVDIFLAHDVEFAEDLGRVCTETAAELHRLKAEGKCRFVGMSGLPLAALVTAVETARLDVVLSYCHGSLNDTSVLDVLLPVAERHDTAVINASPLSMGLLTQSGPPAWHPADDEIKAACRKAAEVCAAKGADLARLALQFTVSQQRLATTLVGMSRVEEVNKNLAAAAAPLDEALLRAVMDVLAPVKNRSWPSGTFSG